MRMSEFSLRIDGEVNVPRAWSRHELASLPEADKIADVSQLDERRRGEAVRLESLLERAEPAASATYVTLHSTDGFSASIPLDAVRNIGLLMFQEDGSALSENAGGPFRFLIPNAAVCNTAQLDSCANVKCLRRIELTAGKGSDTRC